MSKGNYEQQIKTLKDGLDVAKQLRSRAQASKEMLDEQIKKIEDEIRGMGIEPQNLKNEIERLKEEMDRLLEESNQLIPWDLVQKHGKS